MPIVIKKTKSKEFTCEIDVPTILGTKQFVEWSQTDNDTLPDEITAMGYTMREAYKRLVLTNHVLVDGVALTKSNFAKQNFPASVPYAIIEATAELIDETVSQKKSDGE